MADAENNDRAKREGRFPLWIPGILGAILVFAAISILLQALAFDPDLVVTLAAIGAALAGGFIARERYLASRIRRLEDMNRRVWTEAELIRNDFFLHSVAAFVRYDAVSFRILGASQGFVEITGHKPEDNLVDKSMVDVLLTDSSVFRRATDGIRRDGAETSFPLDCRRPNGKPYEVRVNGTLSPDGSTVEAALIEERRQSDSTLELERTEGDLERLRHGMIRREFRILELKGEVNRLCDQIGTRRRYKIDGETHDTLVEELLKEKRKVVSA